MVKISLRKIFEVVKKDVKIICDKCNWTWKESETEEFDKYVCHKCGNDMTNKYK
jgi:hypothetical protein